MKKKTKDLTAREIKVNEVESLTEKVSKAKALVFTDYRGLTSEQMNALRAKIKSVQGELIIAKNTLLSRALEKNKLKTNEKLQGPTAIVFSYEDEIGPIQQLDQNAKETGLPTYKFGFFEKEFIDAAQIETIAKILPINQLQAKIVTSLSSPLYSMVNVLNANIRGLVSVLDQAAQKG